MSTNLLIVLRLIRAAMLLAAFVAGFTVGVAYMERNSKRATLEARNTMEFVHDARVDE